MINKQWGFYGTIKHQLDKAQEANTAWNLMVHQLGLLYPDKDTEEITEFLNSGVGRHFADHLADRMHGGGIGKLSSLILRLNKLTMQQWWNYYEGKDHKTSKPNMQLLYRFALARLMRNKEIEQEIKAMLGSLWTDPVAWVENKDTTIEELKVMWMHLQNKFAKTITHYDH